jgi:hypothetical protein
VPSPDDRVLLKLRKPKWWQKLAYDLIVTVISFIAVIYLLRWLLP